MRLQGLSRASRYAVVLLVGSAGLAGVVMLYLHHPSHYPIPQCPFSSLTGLYCPGCGSLRSLHFLLHGEIAAAVRRNPLAVFLLPYLAVSCGRQGLTFVGAMKTSEVTTSGAAERWLIAAIGAFFVLRNLPFDALDVLRP